MAIELERALVGMAMRDKTILAEALGKGILPGHFTDDFSRRVFGAAQELWGAGRNIDTITVSHLVGQERFDEVSQLRLEAPLTQESRPYIQAILDGGRHRALYEALRDIVGSMKTRRPMDPLDPIIDKLALAALEAKGAGAALKVSTIRESLVMALEATETRIRNERPSGIPTGFAALDDAIFGLQRGFVYVLGARTAVGKTTLATNIAVNAAREKHKVAFVTVEMSDVDLTDKMLTREAKVNSGKYQTGHLSEEECGRIEYGGHALAELPIVFVEAMKPTLDLLALEVMRLVKVEKVGLVIIDYLQLFEVGDDTKYRTSREEIKTVSARLKSLARTLEVPIMVLSQLNRQAAEVGEPELVHMAESDQIVRDADVVMMLYVDEQDHYFLSVAKNRRGPRIRIALDADLARNTFTQGRQ